MLKTLPRTIMYAHLRVFELLWLKLLFLKFRNEINSHTPNNNNTYF